MNAAYSAADDRQAVQLTAMVPIQLPVPVNLACRLLVKVPVSYLVRVACSWVKQCSVPVPVPRRSVVPEAEVEHQVLGPVADVTC